MFSRVFNHMLIAFALVAGLAMGAPALAANTQSAPAGGASSQAKAPNVTKSQMHKFADINVKAAKIRKRYSGQLKSAKDPKKVSSLKKKMNQEILAALKNEGLTVKQYGQVLQAVQQDPQVKKQVIKMMRKAQANANG